MILLYETLLDEDWAKPPLFLLGLFCFVLVGMVWFDFLELVIFSHKVAQNQNTQQ